MLLFFLSFFLLSLAAAAPRHHLFVGTYGSSAVYGVTYDDTTRTLTYSKNNTTRIENEWLALSFDGKTLYSSGLTGWSSFPVTSATSIGEEASNTPAVGRCSVLQGLFIFASRRSPYSVYGSLSCANYVGVGPDGQFAKQVGQIPYNQTAVIYGMAMDPTSQYLYSSDWSGAKIWTHKVHSDGSLTALSAINAPSDISAPRTVVVHPSGKAMYVVLEGWNVLALYTIDPVTHLPVYTKGLYPLIPNDVVVDGEDYGAQSAVVSKKGSILWATTHSRVPGKHGYMTGFKLREDGMVVEQLFQITTPTGGGRSNNIAACPFAEDLIALTESDQGSVSVWAYSNNTAKEIARVQIQDSEVPNMGCCSEAVWLD